MAVWIALAVAAVAAAWLIATYNSLVTSRNQVRNGWSQIDVQLKRRHDLIPNLVNTVKGLMAFEQETLEKVIAARNQALAARGVAATAEAEAALTASLGKLFALAESYPEIKSDENVRALQEELASTENKIAFARQFYNDQVMRFNTATEVFPSALVAGPLGFKPEEPFKAEWQERENPQVDLSLR